MRKKIVVLAFAVLIACVPAFAHGAGGGWAVDILAGQGLPEGGERSDTLYVIGIDKAISDCVTITGRLMHAVIDGDSYIAGGTVGLERHLHWGKSFDPYLSAGVGPLELHTPDVENTVEVECEGCRYEGPCTETKTTKAGDSYMAYYFGAGFDLPIGSVFGLTADARYVKPIDSDGPEDDIQVAGGLRLAFGK